VGILRDFYKFLAAVTHEFKFLLGVLGLTVLRFWKPLYGKDVPNWVFWVGIIACLFGAFFNAWRKEHKKARILAVLKEQCDGIILDLEELADLYLNAPKKEGDPKTLPDPMAPWWASSEWKVWPYRVGVFQGGVRALRQSLRKTTIPVEEWDSHMSVPKLLDALRKYREQLGKLP